MVLWPGQRTVEPNGEASRSSTQKMKKAPRENGNNPFSDDVNELKSNGSPVKPVLLNESAISPCIVAVTLAKFTGSAALVDAVTPENFSPKFDKPVAPNINKGSAV